MLDVFTVLRLLSEEWTTEWDWFPARFLDEYYIVPKTQQRPNEIPFLVSSFLKPTVDPTISGLRYVLIFKPVLDENTGPTIIRAMAPLTHDKIDVDLNDPNSLPKLKQFIAQNLA